MSFSFENSKISLWSLQQHSGHFSARFAEPRTLSYFQVFPHVIYTIVLWGYYITFNKSGFKDEESRFLGFITGLKFLLERGRQGFESGIPEALLSISAPQGEN